MFRVHAGATGKYCDGMSRRSFVQVGIAGLASVGLPAILRAQAQAATAGAGKKTAVILIWLDGGPSHMDMYDLKPEAPAEYRGIWRPIRTNVPGMEISELFPKQAEIADCFSIIRSLHVDTGDHFDGAHRMLTGRIGANGGNTAGRYPSIGSIAAKVCGSRQPGVPPYVAVPVAASIGIRPGYFAANYLGLAHNPFETEGDPNSKDFQVRNIRLAGGLTIDRLADRNRLLEHFDRTRRAVDTEGAVEAMDRFEQQAYELVTGPAARKAFDLSAEDDATRDRYGRNTWGQSTLLARRLVEAGTTFVTVHCGGWDNHWDLKRAMEDYLPKIDAAVSSLFQDLRSRGLLDDVMVMMAGEFSRTPRMNDGGNGGAAGSMGTPGRDHWGNAMSCLIGGGGVRGGQVIGSTDRLGESPKDRAIRPGDIHATMFHCLGIDPKTMFEDHSGRPLPAIEEGNIIGELV
jgi:uncharacterized protein (DUF1501 family)